MEMQHPVAAVILAAGASRRFGSAKQLAQLGGRPLLAHALQTARDADLDPILAVVPPDLALAPELGAPSVQWVTNPHPELGMSRSLQLGIAAVPEHASAAVILLGDQPTVSADHLRALVAARGERPIVATLADGLSGPPLLLERSAFELAGEATGDAGLRDLIRRRGEAVATVAVSRAFPDVDEPRDLQALASACPGCGARFGPAADQAAQHPYLGASPACWAAFGELLAREFTDSTSGSVHRHTVDAYAAQHPGENGRRQRQSVALHLIALCHWLEHDLPANELNAITQRLASRPRDWPWLEPPTGYPMTVLDVLAAADPDEHVRRVRRWAELVWQAWSAHHPTLRRWAAEAIEGAG